jgi:hypothetical protein
MTPDETWLSVEDEIDFDRLFPDLRRRDADPEAVDLTTDEDPDWRAWREAIAG